jgi:hypothetical protein
VRAVAEAVESVLCPVALRVEVKRLVAVKPVVEALVIFARVEKRVGAVRAVVEARPRVV